MLIKETIERIKGKFSKKFIITILVTILAFFGLIFGLANIKKVQEKGEVVSLPSPSPTPTGEEIITPSAYATDSAILAIEEDLKTLERDLLETDLSEAGLNPPVLDMEVSFNNS